MKRTKPPQKKENLGVFQFLISAGFARNENLPVSFTAVKLFETAAAYYVYGHGEMDPTGRCARCGRELTHPGSILIGIGPECLNDWGARDYALNNLSEADIAYLRALVRDRKVDTWIPRAVVKREREEDSSSKITVPTDHKMLQRRNGNGAKETVAREAKLDGGRVLRITFPFSQKDLNLVKSIPGRRFMNEGPKPSQKYWTAPLSVDAIEVLSEGGFKIDPSLKDFLNQAKVNIAELAPIPVPGLRLKLFPFQELGVSFIEAKNGRALIGDEMGLGKTVQALAYLQLHPELRPVIIVVPASLKLNWAKEAEAWMTDPRVEVLSGTKPYATHGDLLIINYDILQHWTDYLLSLSPKVLVTDECHYYKNLKAGKKKVKDAKTGRTVSTSMKVARTEAVLKMGKKIDHVIALSGTPIVNRPREFFNAINLIDPTIVPSFWKFAMRYCGAKHTGFGWDMNGASNKTELHEKLTSTIMLRRLKKDVLKDLPDKTRSFVPLELDNQKEYRTAEHSFTKWVRDTKGAEAAAKAGNAEALAKIEALKQLAVKGKMKAAIEWVRDFIDSGEKLVLFSVHRTVIDQIMKEFDHVAVKVDGSVKNEDRQAAVERFQSDESVRLFIGNIKAAGVGLTLTAASSVAFLELPWTPGELTQAEDRCHRIGQKNAVNIYYLLATRTIDEEIAELLDAKRVILDAVLDGAETKDIALLSTLIERLKKEGGKQ